MANVELREGNEAGFVTMYRVFSELSLICIEREKGIIVVMRLEMTSLKMSDFAV